MTDDELDPLAPVFYDDGSPEEEPDESDGGFSDVDRVVRVWVADGRLTKVRVSPVWYRKLRNTTMESAFGQAFWQSNLTIAPVPDEDTAPAAPAEEFADVDFSGLPGLSEYNFAAMRKALADVRERRREASERYREQARNSPPPTLGHSQGVTVVLNESGHAGEARFDPLWLDRAQAGNICNHVMLAAADAYARFVPAVDKGRAELDQLRGEHRYLIAAFQAMLDKRGN